MNNSKINDTYTAGQVWLYKTLEKEEIALPDYHRPLKEMRKTKNPFTLASWYGFAGNIIKSIAP